MVLLKDDFRDTALHLSACQGEVGIVKLLLARGADVEAENNLGSTPLNRAAVAGRTKVRRHSRQRRRHRDACSTHGQGTNRRHLCR